MRYGFTLHEVVLALAVLALASGIALPRAAELRNTLLVEQEASRIVAAHRRARIAAVASGRVAVLTVGADALGIRLAEDAADLWRAPGPSAGGVELAGPVRRMTFSPLGYTTGLSNATLRLSRGRAQRTVVVSRLGRVRVTRP